MVEFLTDLGTALPRLLAEGLRDTLLSFLGGAVLMVLVAVVLGVSMHQGSRWLRVVARDNGDLQRVIDLIDGHPLVARSATVICLSTPIPFRTRPLVG